VRASEDEADSCDGQPRQCAETEGAGNERREPGRCKRGEEKNPGSYRARTPPALCEEDRSLDLKRSRILSVHIHEDAAKRPVFADCRRRFTSC
jgi:hypothetical protein